MATILSDHSHPMFEATASATKRNWPFWKWGLILIALYGLFLWAGPEIERRFFPVAGEFEAIDRGIDVHGNMTFRISGVRYRESCQISSILWYGVDRDGRNYLAVHQQRIPAPAFYPAGRNVSSQFVVSLEGGLPFHMGVIRYKCPFLPWYSQLQIGPFETWGPATHQKPVSRPPEGP